MLLIKNFCCRVIAACPPLHGGQKTMQPPLQGCKKSRILTRGRPRILIRCDWRLAPERESNQIFVMTKCFGHYLLSLRSALPLGSSKNNIYILYILSLWHSLPSAAAIGVSPRKSGYGEERRHESLGFVRYFGCKDTKLFGNIVRFPPPF